VVVRPLTPHPLAPIGDGEARWCPKVELLEYYKSAKFHLRISNRLGVMPSKHFQFCPVYGTHLGISHCVLGGNRRSQRVGMCTFRFLDPDFILASLDSFSISRSVRPLYTGGVPCIRYSSVRRRLSPYMALWGKLLFRISREPTYRSSSNFVGRKRTSIPIDRYACHNFPFPFPVYRNSKVCMYLHAVKLQKIITPEKIEIATSGFHQSTHLACAVILVSLVTIRPPGLNRTSLCSRHLRVGSRKSTCPLKGRSQPIQNLGADRGLIWTSNKKNSVEIAFIGNEI
jgi:hypothetical protein